MVKGKADGSSSTETEREMVRGKSAASSKETETEMVQRKSAAADKPPSKRLSKEMINSLIFRPFKFPRKAKYKSPYGLPFRRLPGRDAKEEKEWMKNFKARYGSPDKAKKLYDGIRRLAGHEDRVDAYDLARIRARDKAAAASDSHTSEVDWKMPLKAHMTNEEMFAIKEKLTKMTEVLVHRRARDKATSEEHLLPKDCALESKITPSNVHGMMTDEEISAKMSATMAKLNKSKKCMVVDASKVEEAIEFYKTAFGFEEVSRVSHPEHKVVMSAELRLGSSVIVVSDHMIEDTFPMQGAAWKGLEVNDVVAAVAKAVDAGAVVELEASSGSVRDPYGKVWLLYSPSQERA